MNLTVVEDVLTDQAEKAVDPTPIEEVPSFEPVVEELRKIVKSLDQQVEGANLERYPIRSPEGSPARPPWTFTVLENATRTYEENPIAGHVTFVDPGEALRLNVTVENRIPQDCQSAYAATHATRTDDVQVQRWTDWNQEWERPESFNCPTGHLLQPGNSCHVNDTVQAPDTSGEVRVRYLVYDEDPVGRNLLLGIERLLVVGERPNLVPSSLTRRSDETAHTTYEGDETFPASLEVANEGDYPDWIHNAGPYTGYSPFSGDGGFVPESLEKAPSEPIEELRRRAFEPFREPQVPACVGEDGENNTAPWTDLATDPSDAADLVCSYRAGHPLPLSFLFETQAPNDPHREPEHAYVPLDETRTYDSDDRSQAILPSDERSFDVDPFTLDRRAGVQEVTTAVGLTPHGWLATPEDATDNVATFDLDVDGVDLRLDEPTITTLTPSDRMGCGLTPEDVCPAGSTILLDADVDNAGDPALDQVEGVRERAWTGAVYIDGERVDVDTKGQAALATHERIPPASAGSTPLWESPLFFDAPDHGEEVTVEIRLDDASTYGTLVPSIGNVAERTEATGCPDEDQPVDNVYCRSLYIEDAQPPTVHNLDANAASGASEIRQGEIAMLAAKVTDPGLRSVNASVTYPDGTQKTLPLEQSGSSTWTRGVTFDEHVGEHTFTVRAEDASGNVAEDTLEHTFTVHEWPKQIKIERASLNDASQTQTQTHQASEYQGNASDPDNRIRVEAETNETGWEGVEPSAGHRLVLEDFAQRERYEVPMGAYRVCDLYDNVTGEPEGTAEGEDCDRAREDPMMDVKNEHDRVFVDTRCANPEADEDGEPPAGCEGIDGSLEQAWSAVEIDWAGSFEARVVLEDPYGNTNASTTTLQMADLDDPPTLAEPVLSDDELEPGEGLALGVHAHDALGIESVVLNVTKPDGSHAEHPLELVSASDPGEGTDNGTYAASLASGVRGTLDQAGSYELTLEATDRANRVTLLELGSLQVTDDEAPQLQAITVEPGQTAEAGAPLTWSARIHDATALKRASVIVTAASGETHTLPLEPTNADGRYQTPPLNTTAAGVGSWTYVLSAADWAGNIARATGTLTLVEELPPQAIRWVPDHEGPRGDAYGGPGAPVQVDLVDYGPGIDRSSVEMRVDGEPVTPGIEDIEHGYRLTHEAPEDLAHGDTVHVTVSAEDQAKPPLVADELSHTYTVDARAPTHDLHVSPVLEEDERLLVGPGSEISVGVNDSDAGPGNVSLVLEEFRDGQPVTSHEATVGPAEPFRLPELASAYAGHGTYRLLVQSTDAAGNVGPLTEHELFLDDTGPRITVQPPGPAGSGPITASIQDDSNVESARLLYTVDGDEQARPMEHDGDNWKAKLPELPEDTPVEVRVEATDTFGHTSSSAPLTLGDGTLDVEIDAPDEGDVLSGNVTVRWTVSDTDVDPADLTASLQYTGRDGFHPLPEAQDLPPEGSLVLDTSQLPVGEVTLHLTVTGSGSFGADKVLVHVQGSSGPFGNLEIGEHSLEDSIPKLTHGQTVPLSVELSEDARAAWANVTTADGVTVSSHALERADDGSWEALVQVPADAGTYRVELTALTDDGAASTEDAYSFQVASEETSLAGPLAFLGATMAILLAIGFGASKLYLARRGGN